MEKKDRVLDKVSKEDLQILTNSPTEFWKDVDYIANNVFSNLEIINIEIPGSVKQILGSFA